VAANTTTLVRDRPAVKMKGPSQRPREEPGTGLTDHRPL